MNKIVDGKVVPMTASEVAQFEAQRPAPVPTPPSDVEVLLTALVDEGIVPKGKQDAIIQRLRATQR